MIHEGEPSFHEWQTTDDFFRLFRTMSEPIDSDTFFNSSYPAYQDLKEAYVTAKFAHALEFRECKLVKGDFPDAMCRSDERQSCIEITELQDKGRRRGDENRLDRNIISHSDESLKFVILNWREWLIEAIQKKSAKQYDTQDIEIDLVVYMNVSLYQWESEADNFWKKMQSIPASLAKSSDNSSFRKVWVVYKNHVVKVWPEFRKFTDSKITMEF